MRILIISQYFWPESFVINDLARSLTRAGHKITVVTGKPNYPTGRIATGYKRAGIVRETFSETVEIIRVPLHPRGNAGALELSLNYLSFLASGLLHFPYLLRGRNFDTVLFFGVSPLTAAIPAVLMAWLKKAHLALWIQDLWPESLSATGFVTNRAALGLMRHMMRIIYACADTLLLQSEAFAPSVKTYADSRKFVYFPNPAPEEESCDVPLPEPLEVYFQDCFPIVFAGNLGRAQSLETITEAAKHLQIRPEIRFIIVGTGSEVAKLHQIINDNGLQNIWLTGLIERKLMPAIFHRARALLVTLRNEPALNMVVPSKVQAYMQAGRPIIGALNGEGARIIKHAGSGMVVPAEDSKGLADLLLTLHSMRAKRRETMGQAGRRYFETHFEIENLSRRLINILECRIGVSQNG